MSEQAQPSDGVTGEEKRRHPRKKVIWSARVATRIGDRACTILNISRGGAQIKLDLTLDPCSGVELAIAGIGKLPGWVVWSSYDRAGIEFTELSEGQAAALEQALRGRRGAPLAPVS